MKTQYHLSYGSLRKTLSTFSVIGLLAASALAQVPEMISYQGRVLVENTNFNGNGQFKFALVQGAGPTLLWKNDGSSGDTEPAAAVTLPVANGLVMALLGDTTLAGMTAIPTAVFVNSDVRLRVWFNGGLGFQQLLSDQRIVSVGYAMMAGNVPDGSITATKLADGAISSQQLADSITLGTINSLSGRLDIYRTAANTPAISLVGSNSQINTYGNTGLEQSLLGGLNWGVLLLRDGSGNDTTVQLSAQESTITFPFTVPRPGGTLRLLSGVGNDGVYLKGSDSGGVMSLYQNDGELGVFLDGDDGGAGAISVRGTNGSTRVLIDGFRTSGGGEVSVLDQDGTETAQLLAGSSGGILSLHSAAGQSSAMLSSSSSGGALYLYDEAGGPNPSAWLYVDADGSGRLSMREGDATETVSITSSGSGKVVVSQGDGSDGVVLTANNGLGGGGVTVYRDNGTFAGQLIVGGAGNPDGYLGLTKANSTSYGLIARGGGGSGGGFIQLYDSAGLATITLNSDQGNEGRITTQVLQITGGSDLSEQFDIKASNDELKAGMIVCIDPDQPGQLVTSAKAYDKTVAGIVSGAGGVKPGMLMGQQGTAADGQHPVALTGRVYCWVDASKGAVRPGDLITTSEMPGHGMKVKDHKKAQGAVIGKAMSSLETGKGLVLVLVSLQ